MNFFFHDYNYSRGQWAFLGSKECTCNFSVLEDHALQDDIFAVMNIVAV